MKPQKEKGMRFSRVTITMVATAIGVLAIAVVSVHRHYAEETANQSVNGELVEYELAGRTLTLRTENGDRSFLVPDGTPLHEGAKTITAVNLTSASGCPAKVWYREAVRQPIASEVRISCGGRVLPKPPSPSRPQ